MPTDTVADNRRLRSHHIDKRAREAAAALLAPAVKVVSANDFVAALIASAANTNAADLVAALIASASVSATDLASIADSDPLYTTPELAKLTGLSSQFFEIGRHRGYGPRYLKLSTRRIRYRRSDVVAWLEERAHQSTAEYGTTGGRPLGSKVSDGKVLPPAKEVGDATG